MYRIAAALVCAMISAIPVGAIGADRPDPCRTSVVPIRLRSTVKDFSGTLPIPDYLDAIIACNTQPTRMGPPPWTPTPPTAPESAWLDSERALFKRVLSAGKVDVLVVPFQVQGYGLDRIERALMTADLANAVGSAGQYKVADPFLVSRALGEGMRRIDRAAVLQLADSIGAHRIIFGYVGHDSHHTFTLTLQLLERPGNTVGSATVWQQDWRAIPFTDEQTPAFEFHRRLPEILRATPLNWKAHAVQKAEPSRSASHINVSPHALVSSRSVSVPAPLVLDLLGALTPAVAELERERIMVHALLAGMNSGNEGPKNRFFEAYALFYLMRRPTALARLTDVQMPQDITLRALLDGNLPAAEASIQQVPDSLERLLLQISLRELENSYGRDQKTQPAATRQIFGDAYDEWQPLVKLHALDTDKWYEVQPIVVKAMLDQAFPEPGFDVESLVGGTAVARGAMPDDVDIDLANTRHILKVAEHAEYTPWGERQGLQPTSWDLLWLLEGLGEARINKSLRLMTALQGRPESAIAALTRYEPLLSGNPALEAARADAALQIAEKSPDDVRETWLSQAARSAAVAAHWAPGENSVALRALTDMGIPSAASQFMVDAYGYDYPRRSFWPEWLIGSSDPQQRGPLALEGLTFSSSDITPLGQLPPGKDPGQAGYALASLGSRFQGNPAKPDAPATNHDGALNGNDPKAKLEHAIGLDPTLWANYWSLGSLMLQSGGKYEEASSTFLRYPGFYDQSSGDSVALSNEAYEAGSLLYWYGEPELAKPLYTIAADLDTGSNASMTSQVRLQIMSGDYLSATAGSFDRAVRYSSPQAYRDYLCFLHAFGKSDEAWKAFSQLNASFDLPALWVSALVGHRRQGLDERALRAWLNSQPIREARYKARQFAPYYAVLSSSTDRLPARDLGPFIEQLEGPAVGHIDEDGRTLLVPHPIDPKGLMAVHPSVWRAGKSPSLPPDTPIKSDLAYFADAYAALRWGDYTIAVARFLAMADRYPIDGYPLGYFAYAAAKSGDREGLEKYVDGMKAESSFDYWLARAFFASARKDTDSALDALRTAFRRRPYTDYRPILTEYQYAEACEWLYKDLGDPRFKVELLDWLRKHQVIQPTHAWAYAMEYTYQTAGDDRVRALAMAHYLDPASERIRKATLQELRAADAWFRDNNPFRLTRPKTAMSQAALVRAPPQGG